MFSLFKKPDVHTYVGEGYDAFVGTSDSGVYIHILHGNDLVYKLQITPETLKTLSKEVQELRAQ